MVHKLGDDRFGLQIVAAVVVVALGAHGAIEALHDTVRFGMPRLGLDVDQVMGFDDRRPRIASAKMLPVGVVASAEMLPATAPVTMVPPLIWRDDGNQDDARGAGRTDQRSP